jgi:acyl-CoA synthetase (NDP forming)
LVSTYGIDCLPTTWVGDAEQAAKTAAAIGGSVVLKAAAGDLVHKTELGAVRINVAPKDVAREYTEMAYRVGPQMGGALVQPMAGEGVEAALGIAHDPAFGPDCHGRTRWRVERPHGRPGVLPDAAVS